MAAGVLFHDSKGRVLLVKPSYKDGWDIPGGYVEPGESPKQAARREVREELGINPPLGRLLVVDWAPHPNEGDKVLFVFSGGELQDDHPTSPAPLEIEDIRFWSVAELPNLMPARLHSRIVSALRLDRNDPYLEYGIATDREFANLD
jgi:8-oxo-dGTP diphosphatase